MRVDCHAHVIDPVRFPYAEGPGYRPRDNEIGAAADFHSALSENGFSHGLLVQPSCYGFDNAAVLDAIRSSGGRLKGVAVVDPRMAVEDMLLLKRQGVVGVRLNIGSFDPDFFRRPEAASFLERCADVNWFVEIYAIGDAWMPIVPLLAPSQAKIIIDHMGHPDLTQGPEQPGFQAVLSLANRSDVQVKLSSFFRVSLLPYPHEDLAPFVRATLQAFGSGRCLWGSDWPFINTRQRVRYEEQLECLKRWVPDQHEQQHILWDNPARLFGFGTNDRKDAIV